MLIIYIIVYVIMSEFPFLSLSYFFSAKFKPRTLYKVSKNSDIGLYHVF